MSPRRGDRVTVPPPTGQWEVRFGTSATAAGREDLCRHALANTWRCLETLRADPRSGADTTASTGMAGGFALTRVDAHEVTPRQGRHWTHAAVCRAPHHTGRRGT